MPDLLGAKGCAFINFQDVPTLCSSKFNSEHGLAQSSLALAWRQEGQKLVETQHLACKQSSGSPYSWSYCTRTASYV